MSGLGETFFTSVGCMDGRVQEPARLFGQKKFNAIYPDTITEAGLVGILADNPSKEFLAQLKIKLDISLNQHHSKGILIRGHQDCAGNPVDDKSHKNDIRKSAKIIATLVPEGTQIVPVFVKRDGNGWSVEEL
ncbi:MAG: hypothetical protein Q8Q96_00105 [bacterium]|nr:hypothetical protein [bacterium]